MWMPSIKTNGKLLRLLDLKMLGIDILFDSILMAISAVGIKISIYQLRISLLHLEDSLCPTQAQAKIKKQSIGLFLP
jgi:hypothetical protein